MAGKSCITILLKFILVFFVNVEIWLLLYSNTYNDAMYHSSLGDIITDWCHCRESRTKSLSVKLVSADRMRNPLLV